MSSMHEVEDEGRGQYEEWLMQHVSEEGMLFIERVHDAGAISDDQARLLVSEAEARLMEDPYGIEAYVSPWDSASVDRVYLVNAYHRSRRYGGAEEGGWWYDHHDPLTQHYAEVHGRAFIVAGPFLDCSDADEVARNLNAIEGIGCTQSMPPNIVWRTQTCVAYVTQPQRYC